ncbi:hypothetical protein T265_08513 [Opisthorchis viverrini]|uniref:Uncharacterized protein n=1 Tax=Opisthorchis viverrini TaxID=6198 RepID=A0A074Z902_OPIVI|nr:hypothetical protein T265_08513 [Opisthorchis viverrini]KER23661.1 hypothetical protein T265_08513 [Opisthorchis viverrini]
MVLSLYRLQNRYSPVRMIISAELYRIRILSVFRLSYRSAIDRCYSVGAVQSTQDSSNPYLLKTHWTDASELADHLFKRIVAVNEHFVVVDKPAGLSVWGHALSKLEALKLLRPKCADDGVHLSIKDCLPHLCKLIDDASSTGTFSQSPVYTFSHLPDGMNPPTSLSNTIPKLYIAESLPASYSGLILLGRTQEYTTAAQKFYRAALKGKCADDGVHLSIKDCLPHLCKLIDDASSTGTFSQSPVYTFSHLPDGMNPPTSLSNTIPKLYIAESLPASYSGLILLGRTQEYTTAAQKFYRAALKGKPPWRMYQQFLAVCLNKPFTLCANNVRFPVGTFALNEHLHVGYRESLTFLFSWLVAVETAEQLHVPVDLFFGQKSWILKYAKNANAVRLTLLSLCHPLKGNIE